AETGLYYNRHRYYDAESGQYLSPDPIGLLGGIRSQGYVHNPLEWVDPLGLAATGDYGKMPVIPDYQKHHNIPQPMANHPAIVSSGYDLNNSRNITYLPSSTDAIKAAPGRVVHRGVHNKAYDDLVRGRLDTIHASNASPEIKRMQIEALSDDLGNKLR
ncbi:RHS repeat-associated core domain-containing protein, partial [Pectobacterium parmentieri]